MSLLISGLIDNDYRCDLYLFYYLKVSNMLSGYFMLLLNSHVLN
ncbi:hypothetical protein ymoll0001_14910 [Yersinia mollaretii ATCC 43969]|uniref:Uncharacterized protein n=1 Tax=Yersinia mollaretii (strain ATCC 43969 / DSM 18520 / CIP 103324 / CNY 7263 / WAIP 204) TaxID=349967 RepID=A0ABM9Y6V9_YERMW|nr:hypothetical protein ymoll0001_14910 [Yersinia mollaretii ATCC 43969]